MGPERIPLDRSDKGLFGQRPFEIDDLTAVTQGCLDVRCRNGQTEIGFAMSIKNRGGLTRFAKTPDCPCPRLVTQTHIHHIRHRRPLRRSFLRIDSGPIEKMGAHWENGWPKTSRKRLPGNVFTVWQTQHFARKLGEYKPK